MFSNGILQPLAPDLIPADKAQQARYVVALAQSTRLNCGSGFPTHLSAMVALTSLNFQFPAPIASSKQLAKSGINHR